MTCTDMSARVSTLALSGLLLLGTAACSDSSPTDPPAEPPVFQGSLVPAEAFPDLAGGVVLTLEEGEAFEIALSLENAPEMEEGGFPWVLREGSCAEPGDPLGDWEEFPPAQPDAEGGWAVTVDLALSPTAERYVVDLRRSVDDRETVLACAEAEPVEG
jgi:hypothetical protein